MLMLCVGFIFISSDWCPENMTYYLGTGVCVGNKTGATWHQGDLFCKSLYPGAHLIDIKSEEDQLAYLPLFGNILDRVISEHKMKFVFFFSIHLKIVHILFYPYIHYRYITPKPQKG